MLCGLLFILLSALSHLSIAECMGPSSHKSLAASLPTILLKMIVLLEYFNLSMACKFNLAILKNSTFYAGIMPDTFRCLLWPNNTEQGPI